MIRKPFILLTIFLLAAAGCKKPPTGPKAGQWAKATSKAFSSGRYGLAGTVFNGAMWAIGGASGPVTTYYSDVYSSSNGSNWTKVNANAPFGGRYGSQVLSYNGQLWLIGGNNNGILMNDVWSSPDGNTWTQVLANASLPPATQFSVREDFGALVYNNAMWVIGGYNGAPVNDVWTSTNGTTWTQVLVSGSGANQFLPRWGLSAVVYNNLMWVIGGATGQGEAVSMGFGDVWNSNNGSVWNNVTNLTPFGPTHYEQTVVNANNLLAVTGGFLDQGWGSQWEYDTSADGINWNRTGAIFPPRFYHLSLEYNGFVWVIGGCDDYCTTQPCPPITYLNDVWYTQ